MKWKTRLSKELKSNPLYRDDADLIESIVLLENFVLKQTDKLHHYVKLLANQKEEFVKRKRLIEQLKKQIKVLTHCTECHSTNSIVCSECKGRTTV